MNAPLLPTLLLHLALLFFWCRIWTEDDRAYFFNPLVLGPMRVVDRVVETLRTPLPFLPRRTLAGLALLGALALKALLWPASVIMFVHENVPNVVFTVPYPIQLLNELTLFLILTFQVAAIHAVLRMSSRRRMDRAAQVVELVSRPVGWIQPVWLQLPIAFLGIGVCILLTTFVFSLPYSSALYLSVLSCVNILHVWSRCVLIAILLSWLGLLMPRSAVALHAREFTAVLMGRLSGLLVVGMMDMTPLVVFIAVDYLHGQLLQWLAIVLP